MLRKVEKLWIKRKSYNILVFFFFSEEYVLHECFFRKVKASRAKIRGANAAPRANSE